MRSSGEQFSKRKTSTEINLSEHRENLSGLLTPHGFVSIAPTFRLVFFPLLGTTIQLVLSSSPSALLVARELGNKNEIKAPTLLALSRSLSGSPKLEGKKVLLDSTCRSVALVDVEEGNRFSCQAFRARSAHTSIHPSVAFAFHVSPSPSFPFISLVAENLSPLQPHSFASSKK